jgi:general secretion pathway protein J
VTRFGHRHRRATSGFTLIELLISITVLAMISMLIYFAFAGMRNSKEGVGRLGDRLHEGREGLRRITRELQSAYISNHVPLNQSLQVVKTQFKGHRGTPAARVDFNSFAHRRLDRDSHESDQAEIGYFGASNPKNRDIVDLVRRVDTSPDTEPDEGGRVDVLVPDIDLFDLSYLDPQTGEWAESWDTTESIGQPGRLPLQVRVIIVLNGGRRRGSGHAQGTLKFVTKVGIPINQVLTFAIQ